MYEYLGSFVARRWWLILVVWIAAAFVIHRSSPTWDQVTKDGDLAYLPARMTSVRGEKLYGEAFPDNKSRSQIVVVLERETGLLQTDLDLAHEIADWLTPVKPDVPATPEGAAAVAVGGANPSDAGAPAVPVAAPVDTKAFPKTQGMAIVEVTRPIRNLVGGSSSADDVVGQKLVSGDKKAAIVVCSLEHEFIAIDSVHVLLKTKKMVQEKVDAALKRAEDPVPAGLNWGLTGSAAVGGDTLLASDESVKNIHFATATLVLFILLIVYQAPILVFVPVITIGVAVFIAKDLVAALTQLGTVPGFEWFHFEIFKTSEIFIFVICFGSGTDFCLFLISRYKEELERGHDKVIALEHSLGSVGEALVGSAFTTVCGLGMMFFSDFGKFTYSGPAIALCLVVTLLSCLTFAPALLRACGKTVFWPFGLKVRPATVRGAHEPSPHDHGLIGRFWSWTSDHIMARPGTLLLVSLVVMAPIAWEGLSVKISYDLLADLPPAAPTLEGTRMLKKHFPAGEMGPITMLVKRDGQNMDLDTPEHRAEIRDLTRTLFADMQGDVQSVRSLMYPTGYEGNDSTPAETGEAPKKRGGLFGGGLKNIIIKEHDQSKKIYVAMAGPRKGTVTRFDIITKYDPFSVEAEQVLGKLEGFTTAKSSDPNSPWHGSSFDFIGTTAGTRDLKAVITSDERLIQQLVVLAVFAVILSILRRPMICLYLIFTVVFSYFVTIGATEWVFERMYGADFTGLDWKVPIFLFVILVAVGEDYNIYLATRIFEEEKRLGRERGLREAIIKTGGIITSCGVIMAGTFVSLMFGTLKAMHALGFALTFGVILDTFIVRPILVPAFLAWLYRVIPERKPATSAILDVPAGEPMGETALLAAVGADPLAIPTKPHTEQHARRTVNR
ncbi:MAG: MMPL family transporter [Planctomycetia bacterium]|nr:MMPL family transporter [Planctomycetia bacterium]